MPNRILARRFLLKLDITDFFGSITFEQVQLRSVQHTLCLEDKLGIC